MSISSYTLEIAEIEAIDLKHLTSLILKVVISGYADKSIIIGCPLVC